MSKKSRGKFWFVLHGWLTLPVWVFLLFVCVTGTIATIDREILWLIDPSVRAVHAQDEERLSMNAVKAEVERQIPGVHIAEIRFGEPYMALEMEIATPAMASGVAWVNPYSGRVQSIATGMNFPGFIRALHGWLLMFWFTGTPIGWYLVCLMGLPLLGAVITGLVVYKRFWTALYRPRLRFGQGARLLWGDIHRLAGVWGSWFIVVIALTGLWFFVVGVLYDLHIPFDIEEPDLPRREAPTRAAADPLPGADLDAALARAAEQAPGARPLSLTPPEHALGVITVYSREPSLLLTRETWVHPYTGDVLGVQEAGVVPLRTTISVIAASLHYGNFGGLAIKLIWTLFGTLLCTLLTSGVVVWWKRTAQATRSLWVAKTTLAAEAAQ